MKRSILLVLALAVSAASMTAKELQTDELPASKMIQQNRQIVKLAAEELTKTLPKKVDKYTTLLRIEGKETTLVYIFEINTASKSDETVRNEDRTRMKKAVTSGICRSSKRFLDADIDISYLYNSAASKEKLFQFNVAKNDCPQSIK